MPQPYNRSLPPGVPGEDFARREDAWKSTSPAVTQLAIQWFQLAIQWFQLAIQWFQLAIQWLQREIQWLHRDW